MNRANTDFPQTPTLLVLSKHEWTQQLSALSWGPSGSGASEGVVSSKGSVAWPQSPGIDNTSTCSRVEFVWACGGAACGSVAGCVGSCGGAVCRAVAGLCGGAVVTRLRLFVM